MSNLLPHVCLPPNPSLQPTVRWRVRRLSFFVMPLRKLFDKIIKRTKQRKAMKLKRDIPVVMQALGTIGDEKTVGQGARRIIPPPSIGNLFIARGVSDA